MGTGVLPKGPHYEQRSAWMRQIRPPSNKGKKYKAIYNLDGDTLRICYALEGEVRPTDFESKAGSKTLVVTTPLVRACARTAIACCARASASRSAKL